MKETTFGWYPPARDILRTYDGKPSMDAYTKECLYKHSQSRYTDKPGVGTPEDPLGNYRWQASPQQIKKYKSVRRSSSPKRPISNQSRVTTKSPMISLEIRGHSQGRGTPVVQPTDGTSRPQSTTSDVRVYTPTAMPKSAKSDRSAKPWAFRMSECSNPELKEFLNDYNNRQQNIVPRPPSSVKCTHDFLRKSAPSTPLRKYTSPTGSATDRKERVQSALTYRPRVDTPKRAVMSAGPNRFSDSTPPTPELPLADTLEEYDRPREDEADIQERMELESIDALAAEPDTAYLASDPYIPPPQAVTGSEPEVEELGVEFPQDYDEQLKKYGWRMQVHGDPLNLKRQCIPKRHAFASSVPVPKVAPDAPKTHKENWDTYFLNTIPRKPMSFTIHPEWASEVLHAKRMELQKRDGDIYKYRHHDYAFIY